MKKNFLLYVINENSRVEEMETEKFKVRFPVEETDKRKDMIEWKLRRVNISAQKIWNLRLKDSFSGLLSVRDFMASDTSLLIDVGVGLNKAVSGRI